MTLENLKELYGAKNYDAAVTVYVSDPASQDAEWHLYGSLAYMRKGQWYAAYQAIWKADELPAPVDVRCKVKFQHGYVGRYLGDCETALRQFDACLSGLEMVPSLKPLLYGWTLFHKGVTLGGYPQRIDDAMNCYRKAAVEFEAEGANASLCDCYHNLAWLHMDRTELELAQHYIDVASSLCSTDTARWQERVLLQYLAYCRQNYTESQRLAEWIEREGPADLRCLSLALLANMSFDLGVIDAGSKLAFHAYDLAMKENVDHRCFRVVCRAVDRANQARLNKSGA